MAPRVRVNRSWRRVMVSLANLLDDDVRAVRVGHPQEALRRPSSASSSSASRNWTYSPSGRLEPDVARASRRARRGDVDDPDMGLFGAPGGRAGRPSRRSSRRRRTSTSNRSRDIDWRSMRPDGGSMYRPGLRTGMTTLTTGPLGLGSGRLPRPAELLDRGDDAGAGAGRRGRGRSHRCAPGSAAPASVRLDRGDDRVDRARPMPRRPGRTRRARSRSSPCGPCARRASISARSNWK